MRIAAVALANIFFRHGSASFVPTEIYLHIASADGEIASSFPHAECLRVRSEPTARQGGTDIIYSHTRHVISSTVHSRPSRSLGDFPSLPWNEHAWDSHYIDWNSRYSLCPRIASPIAVIDAGTSHHRFPHIVDRSLSLIDARFIDFIELYEF